MVRSDRPTGKVVPTTRDRGVSYPLAEAGYPTSGPGLVSVSLQWNQEIPPRIQARVPG